MSPLLLIASKQLQITSINCRFRTKLFLSLLRSFSLRLRLRLSLSLKLLSSDNVFFLRLPRHNDTKIPKTNTKIPNQNTKTNYTKYQNHYQPRTITNTAKTFLSTERCAPIPSKTWSQPPFSSPPNLTPSPHEVGESTEHITSNKAASMINESIYVKKKTNDIIRLWCNIHIQYIVLFYI